MAQLHGSTAENAVWVLPRSHRWGHLDIPQMIAQHGERVPGALPLVTEPGDVAMCNRNCLRPLATSEHIVNCRNALQVTLCVFQNDFRAVAEHNNS